MSKTMNLAKFAGLVLVIGFLCLSVSIPSAAGSNSDPSADFSWFPSSPSRDTIQFTDSSSDPDGSIESWSWSFGDGSSAAIQNPSHLYEKSGTYTVTLTVTDNGGATDSKSKDVTVSSVSPPRITAIEAGENEVARSGDNVSISFQVYMDGGIDTLSDIEIWIKNENNETENYNSWPGGSVESTGNLSPYENSYSFTFDPENSFNPGEASIEIKVADDYGLENSVREDNLFQVTGGKAIVETGAATDLRGGEATLNASISFGSYDNVDVTFYYREKGSEDWMSTGWEEKHEKESFSHELTGLGSETVYEFKAGIRYGSSDDLFDNGSTLSFHENKGVMLIQAELVSAVEGKDTVVSLEVANLTSEDIEAVRVIPPENYKITPSARWIGSMDVDSYLPADFRLKTEGLEDGDNLSFYAVYRSGGETHKSTPLTVGVELEEPKSGLSLYILVIPVVVVLAFVLIYFWRWR